MATALGMHRRFHLGGSLSGRVLEVGGGPSGTRDPDSAFLLRNLVWEAQSHAGSESEGAVLGVFRELFGRSPTAWAFAAGDAGRRARVFESIRAELLSALETGRLRVRDERSRVGALRLPGREKQAARSPMETRSEVEDVWVIAAEVKLFGDTPLIEHEVRIIDPDTGAVVADGLRTDDKGVVRSEVPTSKKYRIEIVDLDLDYHPTMVPEPKHAVLRCEFVDQAGEPLSHRDVIATSDYGETTLTTDEAGRIDVPGILGHYSLKIDDQTFDAHAVLGTDQDEKSVYRFVVKGHEEDGEGDPPENRLPRFDFGSDDLEGLLDDTELVA